VEVGGPDVQRGHLGIGYLDAFFISGLVNATLDREAFAGLGCGDLLDNDLMRQKGFTSPVLRDEGEQAMLDTVPFAGTRRQMRNRDGQAGLIGKPLQLDLPQAHPGTVAATAISGDQQLLGLRIAGLSQFLPPATDALDREGGSIVRDAEVDPAGIGSDVVDTVRRDFAQSCNREVMHADRFWVALGTQFPAAILKVPNKLLLFGIDRYRGLTSRLERVDPRIDVFKLRVAVGVVRALAGLAVRLQAEAQAAQ
jgi:hypothetical protein